MADLGSALRASHNGLSGLGGAPPGRGHLDDRARPAAGVRAARGPRRCRAVAWRLAPEPSRAAAGSGEARNPGAARGPCVPIGHVRDALQAALDHDHADVPCGDAHQ